MLSFTQSSHLLVTDLILIKIVLLHFPTFSPSIPAFTALIIQITDSAHQVC